MMGGLRPVAFAYLCTQLAMAAVLVVFLVGSLILSGAQVTASGAAHWEPVIAFPVFPVPAWLLIGIAALGLILALAWAATSRPDEARALTGATGPTAAAGISSGFFLFAFAEGGAPAATFGIALALTAASLLVVLATSVVQGARHDRRERAADGVEVLS